ncbi:MAG: hypothetical protein QME68_03300 [Elusimicrobiota bacterium]|nr:hypothetical protein [Elusimicrobiota bacterium]
MSKIVSFALKIPDDTIKLVKEFCKEKGLKLGVFVGLAIKEKIEREEMLEDSEDIIRLRYEESAATPLEQYFEKRKI